MGIVKVLKRKDGATLVVGFALGFAVYIFITGVTSQLADKISNTGSSVGASGGWKVAYFSPVVTFLCQLVALELLIWIYVGIHNMVASKK